MMLYQGYLCNKSSKHEGHAVQVVSVTKLGIAVLLTFAVLWLPYLDSTDAIMSVVKRVFPTKRGVFEDYVANFWYDSA